MTDWVGPGGFLHSAASAIQVPNGDIAVVQLLRHRGEPPFEDVALARLDALRPHLARAAMLASRLRLERLRTAVQALSAVGLPAAAVNTRSQVAAANEAFEALTEHVVWLGHGRFRFVSRGATASLERSLADRSGEGLTRPSSFALPGGDGGQPAVAHILPVRGDAQDLFGGGMALVVVTPLGSRASVPRDLVQALFDLTPAESQVATGLLAGRTVAEIARRQKVSEETVRSQVKAVLAKSGAGRQADFIARFKPPLAKTEP